jgi:hypothetical protein
MSFPRFTAVCRDHRGGEYRAVSILPLTAESDPRRHTYAVATTLCSFGEQHRATETIARASG